jgi:hypothetical protein
MKQARRTFNNATVSSGLSYRLTLRPAKQNVIMWSRGDREEDCNMCLDGQNVGNRSFLLPDVSSAWPAMYEHNSRHILCYNLTSFRTCYCVLSGTHANTSCQAAWTQAELLQTPVAKQHKFKQGCCKHQLPRSMNPSWGAANTSCQAAWIQAGAAANTSCQATWIQVELLQTPVAKQHEFKQSCCKHQLPSNMNSSRAAANTGCQATWIQAGLLQTPVAKQHEFKRGCYTGKIKMTLFQCLTN